MGKIVKIAMLNCLTLKHLSYSVYISTIEAKVIRIMIILFVVLVSAVYIKCNDGFS